MTVETQYNKTLTEVSVTDAATTLDELDTIDGTTSDTGGTFSVAFARYQWPDGDRASELHFHVELTDADDSQYPEVRDDLAQQVAGLTVVTDSASEVEAQIDATLT
jgi:hypothetical protein